MVYHAGGPLVITRDTAPQGSLSNLVALKFNVLKFNVLKMSVHHSALISEMS